MTTFADILSATLDEKIGLFEDTAITFAAEGRNIEKDFWVTVVLDMVFRRRNDGYAINFKGGTSLSKGFNLIRRFSEDIDITIGRECLDTLDDDAIKDARLSSNRRHLAACEQIAKDCGAYVSGPLKAFLDGELNALCSESGLKPGSIRTEIDSSEPYGQNLLIHYPSVFQVGGDDYVKSAVKLEAGARGSTTPIIVGPVTPYINEVMIIEPIIVVDVPMIDPVRTFFEKITAIHAFKQSSGHKTLANRLSRHYYDVHEMWNDAPMHDRILANLQMLDDVREHKLLMFFRKNENMHLAAQGTLTMTPDPEMRAALATDYRKMSGMIFNQPPKFDDVMDSIAEIDAFLNDVPEAVPTM